jgi:Lipoproteins
MVRVSNLQNGKSVIVRINNRGPYVKGRIIDLSLVAAQRIEMTKAGVVPVRVEVLRKIEVLPQPNRQLTARAKRAAEQRAAQAGREAGKEKPDTRSGPRGVFPSFDLRHSPLVAIALLFGLALALPGGCRHKISMACTGERWALRRVFVGV